MGYLTFIMDVKSIFINELASVANLNISVICKSL